MLYAKDNFCGLNIANNTSDQNIQIKNVRLIFLIYQRSSILIYNSDQHIIITVLYVIQFGMKILKQYVARLDRKLV